MVRRMARRGALLAPIVIASLWLWNGSSYALSGAVGFALTLLNLFMAARIIGTVAEKAPMMLLPVAMMTFVLGLAIVTGVSLVLRNIDAIEFPVTGFTLIGSHLGLVLWEAAGAYKHVETPGTPVKARS